MINYLYQSKFDFISTVDERKQEILKGNKMLV